MTTWYALKEILRGGGKLLRKQNPPTAAWSFRPSRQQEYDMKCIQSII